MTDPLAAGSPSISVGRATLPVGTVTFLRSDVEGSMALARTLGPRWDPTNADHLRLVVGAVAARGGHVVRTEGDAVFAAFPEAGAAVAAAVDAQRALADHAWPEEGVVRVRMGLHSGEAHLAGADYGGFEVNRAARVAAVGHGGQIVLSASTYELVADDLPAGTSARDLGAFLLKDVPRPERLYQLDVPGLAVEFPPLRAGRAATGNLDARLTSFIGRDAELAELRALLGPSRLITLTGPGGIGKSSLAVELARTMQAEYPDGAWFVPLAEIEDAADVPGLIARTVGLYDGPTRSAATALSGFVAERSMVLVLDNFEHVISAADVVPRLLRDSPRSRIVVTSRAPLHVRGEQEYPVGPLGRGGSTTAAELFADRARAVRPGWDPGRDAAVVDEICSMLDGLPLGVELAAARIAMLPVPVIRDRLADRLPLPGGGPRDAPMRQRTLDGAVAWSHDLLAPGLRRRLHRLSVFEGGLALDQAADVTSDDVAARDATLEDLLALVDQSLLERDPSSRDLRFRMLGTIATFAAARLADDGDERTVRRRHAESFLALAVIANSFESTREQRTWFDRLAEDEANLRAAVRWSIEAGEAELALRSVAAMWRFWRSDGHLAEGRRLIEDTLAMPEAQAGTEARMWALGAAGSAAYWQADSARAHAWYRAELDLAETLEDPAGIADAVFNIAHTHWILMDDLPSVRALIDEAARRYRDLGDERGAARAEWGLGNLAVDGGDPAAALGLFKDSLARFEALGDAQYHAMTSASLAWATFALGDRVEAIRWATRGLEESYEQGDLGATTISLHIGVLSAVLAGHPDIAARLTGAYDAGRERYGVNPPAALERFLNAMDPFAMARSALPAERWDQEYEAGRRLTLGEAVELVAAIASGLERLPG